MSKLLLIFLFIATVIKASFAVATCNFTEFKSRKTAGYSCRLTADTLTDITGDHVAGKFDSDLQFLLSVNQTIPVITPIFCNQFPNLERIDIFKSKVEVIDQDSFRNCKNLERLLLSTNNLQEIPENLLTENTKIEMIRFNKNQLTTLPEDSFATLKELKLLYLYDNKIKFLPKNIFKFNILLRSLHLSGNQLTTFDSTLFQNLRNLERLSMHDNQLVDLPKDAFVNLQNLSIIWMSNNNLTAIHGDSFGVNQKFEQLYVEHNKINAIDETMINNTAIHKFEMTGNVCSQRDICNRFEMKEAFQSCFDNYRPRDEQNHEENKYYQ